VQEYKKALRQRDETFHSLSGPVERAEFDADLFVRHYFAPNGKPNHSITPGPLVLKGYKRDWGKIAKVTNSIPGLEFSLASQGYQNDIVCLGWDVAALRRIRKDIEVAYKVEREKQLWQEAMKNHEKLVKETRKAKKGRKGASEKNGDQRGELSRCVGSYIIRCDAIGSRYGTLLTINIQNSGPIEGILVTAIDWGDVEGTMLLSSSEEELDNYIGSANGRENAYDDIDEDDGDGEDWGSGHSTTLSKQSNKRKAPAANPKRGRPSKKAKVGLFSPRRLHYRLKGHETGEGEMFCTPYKGYFDFDDTYTSFKGKANSPYIRSDAMEGLKTDNKPRRSAEPWNSFSEAAYERARVARWH
jgi:hypothetical protein